jgi:hypothetical protein
MFRSGCPYRTSLHDATAQKTAIFLYVLSVFAVLRCSIQNACLNYMQRYQQETQYRYSYFIQLPLFLLLFYFFALSLSTYSPNKSKGKPLPEAVLLREYHKI